MKSDKIRVELGERSYDIIFDTVDSPDVQSAFAALPQKNVLIVADSNTAQYLPRTRQAFEKSGKCVHEWVFPAGESSKNMDNAMKLCGYASSLQLGRNAIFAALGGGVTGDLTGFAAAMFMRGVDFIQIPTSLLAMVDSSVGGKTAVDTAFGKNLVGAFHQPKLVVIDCGMLMTLPAREIGSGMAEIVKTAMILDRDFAGKLAGFPDNILLDPAAITYAVKRSCQIKARVVSQDEKETGDSGRVFLNYGHTFGHAIEHLSCFRLAHGEAVACGMDIAAFAARELNLSDVIDLQHSLLKKFSIAPELFPASAVRQSAAKIVELMKGDKKNGDGKFRAVLPLGAGAVKTVDLDPEWTRNMVEKYFSFRLDPAKTADDDRPEAAIIGLGLLGSSLALSIDRRKYAVSAWDRSMDARTWAIKKQAVDKVYDTVQEAFASADIVILCLPIPVTKEFIIRYHADLKNKAVLTDIASVKGGVMETAGEYPELNFVGSHPMAGTEKSGCWNGFKGLYDNADVFIVPGKYSNEESVSVVEKFWQSLNTHTVRITTVEHDALVAHTSHMLHIIASALTGSILNREDIAEQRRHYAGCATGFRDTSRIASSSPEMWKEICMENAGAILPALDEFQKNLTKMRETLIDQDGEAFAGLFCENKELRDSWLCYKRSHTLPENIVLCGIKHCGKSTVGRECATVLDIKFTDTDAEIEKKYGKNCSCREIFKTEGEEFFRKLEAQVICDLAGTPEKRVIALGGGALSNPYLPEKVKDDLGFKVWLDVDDRTAFERIKNGGLPPFLANANDPFSALAAMNKSRREIFAKAADVKVENSGSVHRTALRILSLFSKQL